jgi:hypothetical protein
MKHKTKNLFSRLLQVYPRPIIRHFENTKRLDVVFGTQPIGDFTEQVCKSTTQSLNSRRFTKSSLKVHSTGALVVENDFHNVDCHPSCEAASRFENTPQACCKSFSPRSASNTFGSLVASALQTPPCVFESTSLLFPFETVGDTTHNIIAHTRTHGRKIEPVCFPHMRL